MIKRPLIEQMAVAYATQIEEQQAEIERLRKALERTRPHVRNEILEEGALVAWEWPRQEMGIAVSIAVAIRALKDLKDKP